MTSIISRTRLFINSVGAGAVSEMSWGAAGWSAQKDHSSNQLTIAAAKLRPDAVLNNVTAAQVDLLRFKVICVERRVNMEIWQMIEA